MKMSWFFFYAIGVVISFLPYSIFVIKDYKSGKLGWVELLVILELAILSWLHVVVYIISLVFSLESKKVNRKL